LTVAISPVQDDYHVRAADSFAHAHEIVKPFGQIDIILTWAKSELSQDWRWQLVELSSYSRPGRYIFYFDSERDYLSFVLKWS
jgi:hypothetical protein